MKEGDMIGLIVLVLILIGNPPPVGADAIMTLEATSGSLRQVQDSAFGSGVSGPGFALDGFGPQIGSASPLTVSNLHPVPGQLFDQSGELLLDAPLASVNGHSCCRMEGILNISAIPSVPVPGSGGPPTLLVTAPFTASGILAATDILPLFGQGQGPFGNYFFEGTGSMTSEFRATCGTVTEPACYFWNSSVLTFAPTVPEPSTWLLLTSGLMAILLSRRRLAP
jgi:hypothetical protein